MWFAACVSLGACGGGVVTGDAGSDALASESGSAEGGATDAGCRPSLNQADAATGFVQCADGTTRRDTAMQCPTEVTAATSPCAPMPGADCTSDSQCTMGAGGYCAQAHQLAHYCGCYYGCRQDSDCASGQLCECGVVLGSCVPATCRTSADCPAGRACVATSNSSTGSACGATRSYACQTANDQCASDRDCANNGACLFDGTRRSCGASCPMHP